MIEIKNLACGFGKKSILQNINLTISEHLSILGANGSGKSTFAKALCSLVEYEGEIFIDAQNITELSLNERAKMLSYIPAKLDIYDDYISVEEFVLLGRFPHKKNYFDYSDKDKQITLDALKFLKISHLKNNAVSSLSSGEQQLTLIAQALAGESKIIIFDEPTANLDPHNSKIIAEHIKDLKKKHCIILITHDLHLACYVGNSVAFLKEKQFKLYEKEFFTDETLQELYGVAFASMVPQYA